MGRESFRPTSLTLPMVAVGTLLGSLVCAANMYFGLQVGTLNTISTSTALLSFSIFQTSAPWFPHVFTPSENAIVQTIASSIAGMPLAASMLSAIPAFEFLRRADEGGGKQFSLVDLVTWSMGVSLFGTIFAAPFRTYFLLQERLRFPGGYATGVLIGALHNDDDVAHIAALDKKGLLYTDVLPMTSPTADDEVDWHSQENDLQGTLPWAPKIKIILKAFCSTACYVVVSYFLPMVNELPVFGLPAARDWLWYITLSPAFTAFGMILDPAAACSMLLGAVLGWGVLSPIVKGNQWAPGPVERMEDGVRGWLIWISIGLLLGDIVVRALHGTTMFSLRLYSNFQSWRSKSWARDSLSPEDPSRRPLLAGSMPYDEDATAYNTARQQSWNEDLVSINVILYWLFGSILCCVVCTFVVFHQELPLHIVPIAIVLALPLALIVIQSSGETSTAPSQSLSNACQFIFILMMSKSAGMKLISMIAGSVTEAGLWQSAALMTDLKTGYLVRASPKVMFQAQLLGSVIGAWVCSGIYRLFTITYEIPSDDFPVPLAHMWANTARLANGGTLPKGAMLYSVLAFLISAVLRSISLAGSVKRWSIWVPSGTAMSIGMYVPPSISLAKAMGAVLRLYWMRNRGVSEVTLMSVATGCILAEGTLGFLPTILAHFGVPRLPKY